MPAEESGPFRDRLKLPFGCAAVLGDISQRRAGGMDLFGAIATAFDAEFKESEHPRGKGGMFATTSAGSEGGGEVEEAGQEIHNTLEGAGIGQFSGSLAEEVGSVYNDLGSEGDLARILKDIEAITEEDRAKLKEDEVFTAEEELEDFHQDFGVKLSDVHEKVHDLEQAALGAIADLERGEEPESEEREDPYTSLEYTPEDVAEFRKIVDDAHLDDIDAAIYSAGEDLESATTDAVGMTEEIAELEDLGEEDFEDAGGEEYLKARQEELKGLRDDIKKHAATIQGKLRELAAAATKVKTGIAAKMKKMDQAQFPELYEKINKRDDEALRKHEEEGDAKLDYALARLGRGSRGSGREIYEVPEGMMHARTARPWVSEKEKEDRKYRRERAKTIRQLKELGVYYDAAWREEDHPRGQPGNAGQFGSGGGGSKGGAAEQEEPEKSEAKTPSVDTLPAAEVASRLADAEKRARAIPETHKIDTPERRALRAKITNDLYERDIGKRKRERKATLILGLPASGKSSLAGPIIEQDGALEVDPDLAKAMLPEYQNGIGAAATHEESSEITRAVMDKALTNGDNIAWPRVDSPEKVIRDIKHLKKIGYKVHVKHLEVSPEIAERSATDRFLKSGRYVSPLVIREYGNRPRESYDAVKASGLADSTEMYERGYTPGKHSELKKVD